MNPVMNVFPSGPRNLQMWLNFSVACRLAAFCMILESLFLGSHAITGNHGNFSLLLTVRKLTSECSLYLPSYKGMNGK